MMAGPRYEDKEMYRESVPTDWEVYSKSGLTYLQFLFLRLLAVFLYRVKRSWIVFADVW